MIENPFLVPPQVESAQSRSWSRGFTWGFQGPTQSSLPREDLGIEDNNAFDAGTLAGQETAFKGLPLGQPCIDLNVEGPALAHPLELKNLPETLDVGAEALMVIHEGLAGLFGSGILLLVGLSIGLEIFSDDPGSAITDGAGRLQAQLREMGFDGNFELFVGGGIDLGQAGCELRMTSIFRQQDDAQAAVSAMGRPHWIIASWRMDQSGGASVVASA